MMTTRTYSLPSDIREGPSGSFHGLQLAGFFDELEKISEAKKEEKGSIRKGLGIAAKAAIGTGLGYGAGMLAERAFLPRFLAAKPETQQKLIRLVPAAIALGGYGIMEAKKHIDRKRREALHGR